MFKNGTIARRIAARALPAAALPKDHLKECCLESTV